MLLRQTKRVNYEELSSEDEMDPPPHHNNQPHNTSVNEERISIEVMCYEIPDLINEHKFENVQPDELKSLLAKFELIRKSIRTKSRRIVSLGEVISDELQLTINTGLDQITKYIQESKEYNSKSILSKEKKRVDEFIAHKEQALKFNMQWAKGVIDELEQKFKKVPADATSIDLANWRKELSSDETKFNKLSESYKECLQISTSNPLIKTTIKQLGERYFTLDSLRQTFTKNLSSEISNRELDVHSEFKRNKLNINLEKFTGYESKTDFYTFRSNFEKMHLSSTPKSYLPDLLVNNYLADPAYTMVKNLESIDEIWKRLEQAFGDTRMMLKKKINQLKSLEISKKNPEKLVSDISNLISMMQEMAALAKKHGIEEHLYYGDTLTHIQNLLGDGRTTRFLSETYEDDFTPRETWTKMITFLTKERRIAEQKLILRDDSSKSNDNNKSKEPSKNTKDTRYGHYPNSYVSDTSNPLCALCETPAGEDHHVATSGPGQTRLIQYYTCQLFAEMKPASHVSLFKSKGNNICFQSTQCFWRT